MKIHVDLSKFENPTRAKRAVEMYRPVFEKFIKALMSGGVTKETAQHLVDKLTRSLLEYLKPISKIFHTPEQLHWATAFHRDSLLHDRVALGLKEPRHDALVTRWFKNYAEAFNAEYSHDPRAEELTSHIWQLLPAGFVSRQPLKMTPEEKKAWDEQGEGRLDLYLAYVLIRFKEDIFPDSDLKKAFLAMFEDHRFDFYKPHFAHFFETAKLNRISSILNWNPKGKTVRQAIIELRALEAAWSKSHASELFGNTMNKGDPVIKFKDGTAWFRIRQEYCELTAAAMGHCGNAPSRRPGDEVWNFGKLTKGGYRPALTFIVNRGPEGNLPGIVGEMKGRANRKPHENFHPHIVRLFESDWIGFMLGGGYASDNNFHPTDLKGRNFEAWSRLIKEKPSILSAQTYMKQNGKEASAWLAHHALGIRMRTEDIEAGQVVPFKWKDISEFVEDVWGHRKSKFGNIRQYIRQLNGDEFLDFEGPLTEGDIDNIFEAAEKDAKKNPYRRLLDRLVKYVLENKSDYSEEDEEEIVTQIKAKKWYRVARVLENVKGDVHSTLWRAASDAYRYGTEAAMAKAVKDWFEGLDLWRGELVLTNGNIWEEIKLVFSLPEIGKMIDDVRKGDLDERDVDLSNLGNFIREEDNTDARGVDWEWDEQGAVDYLHEELPDWPKQNPVRSSRSLSL